MSFQTKLGRLLVCLDLHSYLPESILLPQQLLGVASQNQFSFRHENLVIYRVSKHVVDHLIHIKDATSFMLAATDLAQISFFNLALERL